MSQVDELCATEGRDPATLRRCLFAGWANEPVFASVDETAEYVGRYIEAGATDFTFYLCDPAEPAFDELVGQHRMATREQPERAASDVFSRYRPGWGASRRVVHRPGRRAPLQAGDARGGAGRADGRPGRMRLPD